MFVLCFGFSKLSLLDLFLDFGVITIFKSLSLLMLSLLKFILLPLLQQKFHGLRYSSNETN